MYEVRYICRTEKGDELVAMETPPEHPPESHLREMVQVTGADFADVCREDEE